MAHHRSIKFPHRLVSTLAVAGFILGGCAIDDGEVDPDMMMNPSYKTLAGGGAGGDPDTHNTLDDDCLNYSGVLSTLRTLGQGPIADINHYLPSMPNMPAGNSVALPACRRELLQVVTECALGGEYSYDGVTPGSVVTVPAQFVKDGGDTFFTLSGTVARSYYGRIGLAPAWETRALTESEQEFVTACVMARTNYYGNTVNILVQGHEPIAYNADWRLLYSYAESTVWGNVFTPTPSMHVCHNPENGYCIESTKRICDNGTNCGFTSHGNCPGYLDPNPCSGSRQPAYCKAWPNRISVFLSPDYVMSSCPEPITP